MAFYLAFKEVWRNKGRFFLFSLVIALITTLVLFIAALAEGLAESNKEYLEKLDAELLVFQENVDLSVATSRIGRSLLNDIRRVDGVYDAGPIGYSNGSIPMMDGVEQLDVSLVGVEVDKPGMPPVLYGETLRTNRANDVVVDGHVVSELGTQVGDEIIIKTIQGTEEKYFSLDVAGITDGRKYLYQPSIFVPYRTWERIRPQAASGAMLVELTSNLVAVKLLPGEDPLVVATRLEDQVDNIEVTDPTTAINSLPGYSAQQATFQTQQGFTLLIGVLVIGGFFQIQMLQKVPLIGVLKAIGTANAVVAAAVVMQIILVTTFGVLMGALATYGLTMAMPSGVPVVFDGQNVALAIAALLLIGPAGGLVSVRLAIRVEPLRALGL